MVNTRLTPAYFPAGDVTVLPLKENSCGPVQEFGRLVNAKLPAPSETVDCPIQPVVLPLPSCPTEVTVTPVNGVSRLSAAVVRPRSVVVGPVTASETGVLCETGRPFTVAAAVTESVLLALTGWLAGAVNVSTEVWPELIEVGTKAAVTPLGTPVMLSAASCVKPLVLLSCTA